MPFQHRPCKPSRPRWTALPVSPSTLFIGHSRVSVDLQCPVTVLNGGQWSLHANKQPVTNQKEVKQRNCPITTGRLVVLTELRNESKVQFYIAILLIFYTAWFHQCNMLIRGQTIPSQCRYWSWNIDSLWDLRKAWWVHEWIMGS